MKALAAAAATVIFALLLTAGCSAPQAAESDSGNNNGGMYRDTWHKMPDGRTVYCLYIEGRVGGYSSGNTPAFECDFAGAIVHK